MAIILVVTNDYDFRGLIVFALRFAGHEVRVAANGEECFRQADLHKPGMILLDEGLPDMSGFEVAKALKSNDKTVKIPILFLISNAEERKIELASNAGVDGYLLKTTPIDQLTGEVNARLRNIGNKPLPGKTWALQPCQKMHDAHEAGKKGNP